ncbi:peptidoglycan-binding domain-containing protein [Roseimicrobium gellanilyticum]|nr:peptidoglycan-binding domain-containing protein [Roseimicrobium gellanilyticum]
MKRILSLSVGVALALITSYSPLQAGHRGGCYGGGHYHGGSSWAIGFSPGLFWSYPLFRPAYYRPAYYEPYGYGYGYGYRPYYRPAVSYSYYNRPTLASDVQIALARRGYYYGNIDGIIGPQSRSAIRRYQVRYGLPVTGVIDYPLMRSLALR